MSRKSLRIAALSLVVAATLTASPVRGEQPDWRLTAGSIELASGAGVAVEPGLAIDAGGGELRLEVPAKGYGACRFAARWSFEPAVDRLTSGQRLAVALSVDGLTSGAACAADRAKAPRIEVVTDGPGKRSSHGRWSGLFEVETREPHRVTLAVRETDAEDGSFGLRVVVGEETSRVTYRFVPARRPVLPESERGAVAVLPSEPGPANSRLYGLPPNFELPGGGSDATVTLETQYHYPVKLACSGFGSLPPFMAAEGLYRTVINVHNPTDGEVAFAWHVSRAKDADEPAGEPAFLLTPPRLAELAAGESLEIDCGDALGAFCPIGRVGGASFGRS